MIFVTVGSADPFDRMISAVDEWAGSRGRCDVFAQVGKSNYKPRFIETVQFLTPKDFKCHINGAKLIVAHAGIGSIVAALEVGTPIIIMPKWARLGEHRNEHQVATARYFSGRTGITVADDGEDLKRKLDQSDALQRPAPIAKIAAPELLEAIKSFINSDEVPAREKRPGLWSLWTKLG